MTPTLQETLETLYGLERKREVLGLDGTIRLMEALGRPERRFRAIHVAGTNGKGSVCALIERVLRAAGIRVGLFTSPHLVDFRERIRINGRFADARRLRRTLERLRRHPAGDKRTFFEITTALGFDAFAAEETEWAVVEVGLGGRLDCTNVLEPAIAVITPIGLDHTEILGDTVREVAREKAGIVKPGVPVVSGVRDYEAAAEIGQAARDRGARLIVAEERVAVRRATFHAEGAGFTVETTPWGTLELEIGLRGRHQLENAVIALATLSVLAEEDRRITASALVHGLAAARWPGRLEPCPRQPRLWWDAAHNSEGAKSLARAWNEDLRLASPGAVVFAVSRDKDVAVMLAALRGMAPGARLVVTRSMSERALPPDLLRERADEIGWEAEVAPAIAPALDRAFEIAKRDRVLVAGSLFAVGEAMRAVGGAPGAQL